LTDVAVAYQTVGRLGIIYDYRIIYDHRIDANADASRFSTAIAPNFVSALAMQWPFPGWNQRLARLARIVIMRERMTPRQLIDREHASI
jgi:hypothetical protein